MKEIFIDKTAMFIDRISKRLPDDVLEKLRAMSEAERSPRAKALYKCMLDNVSLAAERSRPLCQDTGLVQFFLKAGSSFPLLDDLDDCLTEAVRRAYVSAPLRPNAVEFPSERNTLTNVGDGVPFIEYEIVPHSDKLEMTVYLAGGGSALPGRAEVFPPSVGFEGIARFVADAMVEKGINACPPLVVGVGVAGCMATAAKLAKHAMLRDIPSSNPSPEIAEEERILKDILDDIGIGPQGAGGSSSVMQVSMECAAHHPSSMGVAVQFSCWAFRRGRIIFDRDMRATVTSHGGIEL